MDGAAGASQQASAVAPASSPDENSAAAAPEKQKAEKLPIQQIWREAAVAPQKPADA
jgi:hypothetical protein